MKKIIYRLINIVSGRLNLDAGYFLKGSFWGSLQQMFGVASGLTISYLFGHFISKSLYGEYSLIISYISLLAVVTLPGIDMALIRSIGRGFDASFIQSIKYKFRFSLIGIPIFTGMALYYFRLNNYPFALALSVVAIIFPFIYSFDVFADFLTAKKQFQTYAILAILSSIVFVSMHAFTIFFIPTLAALSLAYAGGLIIPGILGFIFSRKFIKNPKSDKEMYSYGKFLTLTNFLPWTSGHIGNIILAHSLGPEALAIYAVAARLLVAIQKNFAVFHKPVSAKLAYQNAKEHRETLYIHAFKLLGIGLLLTVGLWSFTPLYINFFFGKNYSEAIVYGRFLSLALIPLPLTWVLADMIVYQKNKKALLVGSTLMPTIKIVLYFLLIPKWGISALVLIMLLERFTDFLLPAFFLLRGANKNPP